MTVSVSPLFAVEVVDCMAEGRSPTLQEVFRVAERIWIESAPDRSAFAWGRLPAAAPARLHSLRAARVALCGTREHHG